VSTLSEQFEDAGTDTINHRGRVVKALVRLPVRDGQTVVVRRSHASDERPQGLKLAPDSGVLTVNGVEASSMVLWSTTSPDEVPLTVSGATTSIDVWNCWSMGGVDTSWVGNAGIVTKTTAAGMVLRCSDGIGEVDFADLEVEISVT
jgi:hypothetical protein